uniref:Uncharacterized protein n=1 Tax=Glossina brevipalpis TaxID=37001 RepID=A0A1A9WEZ3_9MUSC
MPGSEVIVVFVVLVAVVVVVVVVAVFADVIVFKEVVFSGFIKQLLDGWTDGDAAALVAVAVNILFIGSYKPAQTLLVMVLCWGSVSEILREVTIANTTPLEIEVLLDLLSLDYSKYQNIS